MGGLYPFNPSLARARAGVPTLLSLTSGLGEGRLLPELFPLPPVEDPREGLLADPQKMSFPLWASLSSSEKCPEECANETENLVSE